MTAYYNEIDPYAAQWLRNLIEAGHIAPGFVDERSIEDIAPIELMGYTQCHFFAGIGIWSLALRNAGWPDDKPVWTGSCPCQPFSSAGEGKGFDDERHLWPHFQWLIEQCRPAAVFGEQVASKDVNPWIDLVQADMEAMGYAFGAVAFPSASIGAPHIRDRTYWLADSEAIGCTGEYLRTSSRMQQNRIEESYGLSAGQPAAGAVNGFWSNADWLHCRDGKWRPVEPGTFPLVDGNSSGMGRVRADQEAISEIPRKDQGSRQGRLKAYGNAINAEQAKIFIECFLDYENRTPA